MKKILIPVFMLLSFALQAQEAETSIVTNQINNFSETEVNDKIPSKITLGSKDKTRGPARWYDIVDAVNKSFGGAINVYANDSYNTLWEDSTILSVYGSNYSSVWVRSVAAYIDPVDPRYNDPVQYPGVDAITNNDPFTVDSFYVPYLYYRNSAKPSIVDTLIISVIYGDGTGSGNDLDIRFYGPTTQTAMNHGTDTLRVLHGFMDLNPASTNHFGYLASSPSKVRTIRIPLTAATLMDTNSNGWNYAQVPINLNVPAGNKVAASMTFKSGDNWTPNADTLYTIGNRATPNYNHIRFVAFEEVSGGHQQYTKGIWTQAGLMRTDTSGWQNRHIPSYAFTNTDYEHQWFQWKLNCSTCFPVGTNDVTSNISELSIYPNPTKLNTTVSFHVEESLHNAEIQLLNLSGTVISSTELGFVKGKSSINKEISTNGIAAGMYFIQLSADEGKRTQKIVIQ